MEPNIGIAAAQRKEIARGLTKLLADTSVLYMKTHGFHWNVTGPHFQSLHVLFEQQYTELFAATDEIAERIRALGELAPGSYAQLGSLASIPEETGAPDALAMVRQLAEGNEACARTARAALTAAQAAQDEVTAGLLTDRMTVHEKTAWMLRATAS